MKTILTFLLLIICTIICVVIASRGLKEMQQDKESEEIDDVLSKKEKNRIAQLRKRPKQRLKIAIAGILLLAFGFYGALVQLRQDEMNDNEMSEKVTQEDMLFGPMIWNFEEGGVLHGIDTTENGIMIDRQKLLVDLPFIKDIIISKQTPQEYRIWQEKRKKELIKEF